jgi:hypothetical protein
MLLNSSDIKSSNNTLYEYRGGDGVERWYIVRDVGTALGSTGRFAPSKGDPEDFRRRPLVRGIDGEFVEFHYHGWHQELVSRRIARQDLGWAGDLLAQVSERQWLDAFRAGGYSADLARPFIDTLHARIAEAQAAAGVDRAVATEGP